MQGCARFPPARVTHVTGPTMPPGVLRARLRRDRFFQLGLALVALVVRRRRPGALAGPVRPSHRRLAERLPAGARGTVPPGHGHPGPRRAEPGPLRRSPLALGGPHLPIGLGHPGRPPGPGGGVLRPVGGRRGDAACRRHARLSDAAAADRGRGGRQTFAAAGVRGDRDRGLGGDGAAGPEPGARAQAVRVRAGRAGAGRPATAVSSCDICFPMCGHR